MGVFSAYLHGFILICRLLPCKAPFDLEVKVAKTSLPQKVLETCLGKQRPMTPHAQRLLVAAQKEAKIEKAEAKSRAKDTKKDTKKDEERHKERHEERHERHEERLEERHKERHERHKERH